MKPFYVNARFLTQPMSGVQRFAAEVSLEMKRRDWPAQFIAPRNILHLDLAQELNCEIAGRYSGHFWEQMELPRMLRKKGSPRLLNLANTGPLRYQSSLATIHDLAFLKHPEWFSRKFITYYQWLIPKIVERSDHVFTVSKFSAREICSNYPIPATRVTVVGNGLSEELKIEEQKIPSAVLGKYILGLTGNNRRKNQQALIDAFALLPNEGHQLVFTGAVSSNFSNKRPLLKKGKNSPIHLSNVSDGILKWLYAHAEVFVYPSFYEGFGLPPLEAMSVGCPVILSDIPVFREIYDGAVHFVDPNHPSQIAEGILKLREDSKYRNHLIDAGKKLAEKHTFKKVVDRMEEFLIEE